MSVKKEADGRRYVQVEVEVPGTPEEVWQAIATGPGISAWFVPTEIEMQDGKPVVAKLNFGPGMVSQSKVTSYVPLKTWSTLSDGWMPGMPQLANEWSVEARAGGVCVVRMVQSLFASTDDWDNQLEAAEHGWPGFLRILQLYLTHFKGQRATVMKYMAPFAGTEAQAWDQLTTALGVKTAAVGQRITAPAGTPAFSGTAEHVSHDPNDILLRLDHPAPALAALGTYCHGAVMIALNIYLYGEQAPATAARETPKWNDWFQKHFPMPTEAGKA